MILTVDFPFIQKGLLTRSLDITVDVRNAGIVRSRTFGSPGASRPEFLMFFADNHIDPKPIFTNN